jgi:hypothetical protein
LRTTKVSELIGLDID